MQRSWTFPALLAIGLAWPLFARSAQDEMEAGEIMLYTNVEEQEEVVAALLCAIEAEATTTGLAAFDSLSALYGLRTISLGDIS